MEEIAKVNSQPNNPLHGVKLADIIDRIVDEYGWEQLAAKVNINCFKSNPTKKSCLKFLRQTLWARDKVEDLYLEMLDHLNEYENIRNNK